MRKKIDLTGQSFGRWTVLYEAESKKDKHGYLCRYWHCKCECGTEKDVLQNSLTQGRSKSCGCVATEKMIAYMDANKLHNKYNLNGQYGIGYTTKGEEFYFDIEDYKLIYPYCWSKNDSGYLISTIPKTKTHIRMHRLIMGINDDKSIIDHINHNKYDNRKSNLRIADQKNNMRNTKIRSTNKSGYKGVCFDKQRKKWIATITVNYKTINLGRYDDINDAIKARNEAENKYFGNFSYERSNEIAALNNIKGGN